MPGGGTGDFVLDGLALGFPAGSASAAEGQVYGVRMEKGNYYIIGLYKRRILGHVGIEENNMETTRLLVVGFSAITCF